MAVCWNHSSGALESFPNLRCVMSYGAGADYLLADPGLPDVKLCRMVLPSLSRQMADYVLLMCLIIQRKYREYLKQNVAHVWRQLEPLQKKHLSVGIMGAGQTGTAIAEVLVNNEFRVNTWALSERHTPGVKHFAGASSLSGFLRESSVLVCALPLTSETDGILNLDHFKQLEQPAYLINIGRGSHLVEEDLIYALDIGLIKEAVLDTFHTEPLPENHAFWNRNEVTITPHIAALTDPNEAAELIIENYKRVVSGMDPLHKVNRERGY